MSEKQFINSRYLREKIFEDGNSVIYETIRVKEFIDELKMLENEEGYASFVIRKRKLPTNTGLTHNVSVSNHVPKQ